MNSKILLGVIASVFVFAFINVAHAQPLEDVNAIPFESESSEISVKLIWNHDDGISHYEIGCVSCFPNLSEQTTHDKIILHNITAFANGNALLYIIAYDKDDIISAKQIVVKLY
ncbi:hypothetical protein [Nitrosopumilus sp.]|uniref:hypothetical protein n=1 Tax=Nitrosopumilus sp. TaxID=2024843 RepID=UPI0034A096EA